PATCSRTPSTRSWSWPPSTSPPPSARRPVCRSSGSAFRRPRRAGATSSARAGSTSSAARGSRRSRGSRSWWPCSRSIWSAMPCATCSTRASRANSLAAPSGPRAALEPLLLLRRPQHGLLLRRARAPAALEVARLSEGLLGGFEPAGPKRDRADRVAPGAAWARLGGDRAELRVEHARGPLLPRRRRRRRRALGRLEQASRDLLTGQVVPQTAGPQMRVLTQEPD